MVGTLRLIGIILGTSGSRKTVYFYLWLYIYQECSLCSYIYIFAQTSEVDCFCGYQLRQYWGSYAGYSFWRRAKLRLIIIAQVSTLPQVAKHIIHYSAHAFIKILCRILVIIDDCVDDLPFSIQAILFKYVYVRGRHHMTTTLIDTHTIMLSIRVYGFMLHNYICIGCGTTQNFQVCVSEVAAVVTNRPFPEL